MDPDRNSVQNRGSFTPGTLTMTPFVPTLIFWEPVLKNILKYARAVAGQGSFLLALLPWNFREPSAQKFAQTVWGRQGLADWDSLALTGSCQIAGMASDVLDTWQSFRKLGESKTQVKQ